MKFQQYFSKIFKDDIRIRIPKIYLEYSSEHILTSSFERGTSFSDFVKNSDQAKKDFDEALKLIWEDLLY